MGYDPKRPRPSVATESQVDALIEPAAPVAEPLAVVPPAPEDQAPATAAGTEAPETAAAAERPPAPVVPAPAEGTANRAVVAAVVAVVAAFVALVVLLRRRRRA